MMSTDILMTSMDLLLLIISSSSLLDGLIVDGLLICDDKLDLSEGGE